MLKINMNIKVKKCLFYEFIEEKFEAFLYHSRHLIAFKGM